jgi:ABC-type sugar transport system substrate-binding protein
MKMVVSLPDQENEYQLLQAADARAVGARLGFDVEVLDAESSPVLQIQQVFKATRGEPLPSAVVVEPFTSDSIVRIARHALQARVAVAFLNATSAEVADVRREMPDVPLLMVSSNQAEIGRVQARQVRALHPAAAHVLYIQGPPGAPAAQERYAGLREWLDGSGIELTILDGHWTETSAFTAVRSWLRLKLWEKTPVDLVAAQDDSMARGARRAIESSPEIAARWSHVQYLGIDGVPDVGQRMVREGQLAATVVMPSNSGPAMEAIHGWLQTGTMPPAAIVLPTRSYPEEGELVRMGSHRAKVDRRSSAV